MPLIRTTFRELPHPSEQAHPDRGWHLLTPTAWQALGDPTSRELWPDADTDVAPQAPFATALELIAYCTGWPRLDLGMDRWRDSGYEPLSPVLGLAAEILGDRLDELTAWLCTSTYAQQIDVEIADAVGTAPPSPRRATPAWTFDLARQLEQSGAFNPMTPDGDPMHLSDHTRAPIESTATASTLYTATAAHPPKAALHLPHYSGWYRELSRIGNDLTPSPDGRSWRISVVCEPVGHLGTFRRSRVSGRWFRDNHAVHQLGIPDE